MADNSATQAAFSLSRYTEFLRKSDELARHHDIQLDVLTVLRRAGYAFPFLRMRIGRSRNIQILLSAGLHGDEPAGVYAALQAAQRLAQRECPIGATIFPCLNPWGFAAGTRRNDVGYDLNRTFGQDPAPQETELVRQALTDVRFAVTLDMHEDDDADGFYVYEHVQRETAALCPKMVRRVRASGLPIHTATGVEGYHMSDGCVVPKDEHTSELIGFFSVFLFDFHTGHSITTETPTRLPLGVRVTMHILSLETIVEALS